MKRSQRATTKRKFTFNYYCHVPSCRGFNSRSGLKKFVIRLKSYKSGREGIGGGGGGG